MLLLSSTFVTICVPGCRFLFNGFPALKVADLALSAGMSPADAFTIYSDVMQVRAVTFRVMRGILLSFCEQRR
jgi:hypothetical protein